MLNYAKPTLQRTSLILAPTLERAAAHPPPWAWSDDALFDDRISVPRNELLKALGDVEWDEDERADRWHELVAGLKSISNNV